MKNMDLKKGILLIIAVVTLSVFGFSAVSIVMHGTSGASDHFSLSKIVLAEGGDGAGDGAGAGDGGGCCGGVDEGPTGGGDAPGGDTPQPPVIPPPTDVCPNIAGLQETIPPGLVKDTNGNCVQDFCPNLPGIQATLPAGYFVDTNGNCVQDFCPNLPGNQTALPPGYFVDANGNCVTTHDFCPNLPGNQDSLPPGYFVDDNGNCVTTTDFCPNLPGIQDTLPPGYFKDSNGNCVTIVDVCPNIPGNQSSVPEGLIKDANGNCNPPPCVNNCTPPPCTVNCGGGQDQPNVFLFRKPGEQPLAFVTLSQIPYTGYEAGPWGVALFWMFLAMWSAFAAYLIAVKRIPQRLVEKYMLAGGIGIHELEHIDASEDMHAEPMSHVSDVKPTVLASTLAMPRMSFAAEPKATVRVVETPVSFGASDTDYVSAVPQFINWIAKGESDKAFDFLRNLRLTKQSAQDLMEKAVCDLDDAYRCRIDGVTPASKHTTSAISHLSNDQVEQLIDALAQGVDRSYGSDYTQAKIALVKALGITNTNGSSPVAPTAVQEVAVTHAAMEVEPTVEIAETHAAPVAHKEVKSDYVDDFILKQIEKNRR